MWRPRPAEDWLFIAAPELRIVSDELWGVVQARREALSQRRGNGGAPARYLLSGLLQCGVCGCSYSIVSGVDRYGCQGHYDRGTCENSLIVRRPTLESQVVDLVTREMLAPAARSRFVRSFNEALKRILRAEPNDPSLLRAAEAEVQNLVAAIAAGAGEIPELVARLRQAKDRVERLQAELRPRSDAAKVVRVLPSVIEKYLGDLGWLMKHDIDGAREQLRRLLGTITLKPIDGGLVATVQGT